MKSILSITLILIIICGFANSQSNEEALNTSGVNVNDDTTLANRELIDLPDKYTWSMAIQNGDVVWSFNEIHNLKKLEMFMENVNQQIESKVRVVASTKEGRIIVKDLVYDGEAIQVTTDQITKKYDKIVKEDRFNEHYNGNFTEYWLKGSDNGDQKELILQIHPDLQKNGDQE